MKVTRAASIPLVTHDPYFSIWSGADHLYDKDPVHWSQIRQQLRGYVNVDGVVYSFLGDKEFHETIGQTLSLIHIYTDETAAGAPSDDAGRRGRGKDVRLCSQNFEKRPSGRQT